MKYQLIGEFDPMTCRAVSSANKNGILLRGPLNFQLRVQNLVRKLRPERVRSQLQCLITTVSEAKLLQRQNLVNRDCDTPCTKDVVTSRDTDDDTRHGASNPELPTTAVAVAVDVQVEAAAQQRKEEDACKQTVMSAGYSASSEADSGGGPRRPCQLALSRDNGHAPLDQQQPIGDECSLPLLVIDSPTNTNHGSATLLCTPSPSPSPRNKSPVTVQEWVDSLPLTPVEEPTRPDDEHVEPATALPATLNETDDILTLGAEAGLLCAGPASTPFPSVQVTTCREPSEAGSHCSSVESLLEARRPDPEEVLLGLGFGGPAYTADTGRIPARFLQPSKLKGVAIDDFLRHQQDLVHNFESGYWGYRGLTGPSHTIPSVIVAKIMEKLREHERENSVASPPPQPQQQFPYHCATPQPSTHHHQHHHQQHNNHNNNNNTTDNNNKFSRVAHNLLTKIRCGSVLTPDNRKWLDSQGGSKSPELARRRLILGQQSFTFSRDGDLIESLSPPSSLTDSDRWTSSTGTTGQNKTSIEQPSKEVKVIFPSIEEDLIDRGAEDNSGDRQQATAAATPTPTHVVDNSVTSLIVDNSVTSLIVDNNNEPKLSATSSFELSEENEKQCLFSMGDSGLPSSGRSSRGLEELESPMGVVEESDECCTMNKIPEEDQGRTVSSTSQRSSRSDVLEGLYTVPPEEMIQSLDKVIESLEKIIEPLEAGSKLVSTQDENCLTRCKEQYNDLKSLTEQMSASGMDVDCGSELQFLSLTANERCALQCRVVRHALNAYHAQLTSDDMHMELKTCLGVEVQKLADLLDSTSDSDRLATIVKQMTSLLEHQTHLGQQLKGLAVGEVGGEGGQEPISCHELCEVVMRRVRSLELLVRRNARELAEIRKRSSS